MSAPLVTQLIVGMVDEVEGRGCHAEGSVSLIQTDELNILVDAGSPKNWNEIEERLNEKRVKPEDVNVVVITHGHIDHCANMGRFTNSVVYMDNDVMSADGVYSTTEEKIVLAEGITIRKFRGHTDNDLVVIVEGTEEGTVVVAGDLFECVDDNGFYELNSRYLEDHRKSREEILKIGDVIIPGHGHLFVNERKNNVEENS